MKTNRYSGVTEISFCLIEDLIIDHQSLHHPGARPIRVSGKFQKIPIEGVAGYTITSEIPNKETIFTTKVSFTIPESEEAQLIKKIISSRPAVFKIKNTDKKEYLLGLNKKPYPMVIAKSNNEGKPGGVIASDMEITYVNKIELLPIG